MERLHLAGVLDGMVFSDAYFLCAVSDAAPDLAACMEAVPGVNFMIDSVSKLDAVLDLIGQTRFRLPGKITLDRSVNRVPKTLSTLTTAAQHRFPGTKIELLANEGCLNHCPFRSTHDAHIAAANMGVDYDTFHLNRSLGCIHILSRSPHRVLASPFIRPEDVHRYEESAEIIKICGRTLGKAFLTNAVGSYIKGSYDGNLLALFDSTHWMAESWDVQNQALPDDFFDRVTTCTHLCRDCTGCRDLWEQIADPLPFRLKDLRFDDFYPRETH
jgi:hypothetical protein